ncbi:MAG: sulfotransferase [Proteobacteria bacterium]|nr:sulfotransferase [Pseudomonadota bacterium]
MTAPASDRHWIRARRYLEEGNFDAARISLESVLTRHPEDAEAHLRLSDVAWEDDRVRDSARHAHAAARFMSAEPDLIVAVGEALLRAGEVVATRACLEHPALAATRSIPALLHMAGQRSALNENAEALALSDRAIAAGARGPEMHFQRGVHLLFNDRIREAEAELRECVRLDPGFGRAWQELARLRPQTESDNHLAPLEQALGRVAPGSYEHAAIEFARYKELEDLGRYAEAWAALARGNALMYARHRHDPQVTVRLFADLARVCTTQFLHPAAANTDGAQPIFIIGMPRSGTTLLDRVLGNHSQVAAVGELDDFARQMRWCADHRSTLDDTVIARLPGMDFAELGRRYLEQTRWRAGAKPLYTDKLPRNWMVAGLIRKALPGARLLHLVRDPMDVCFSNFRALFADAFAHIYDLEALASHYRVYRRTMAHWHAAMPGQILDVAYADLVADPEGTLRKVLAFCGLDWEPGCTDITRNRSAVSTLSAAQVREPVHTRFVDAWRRYEQHLAPLARALAGGAENPA